MDLQLYNQICNRPNVLSRATLHQTVERLRKEYPSLAMMVRNILTLAPVEKPDGIVLTQNTDHFQISLNYQQISDVIEALSDLNMINAHAEFEHARELVLMRTLICEWLDLAKVYLYQE